LPDRNAAGRLVINSTLTVLSSPANGSGLRPAR
jgi:hypothetical protein